MGSGGRERACDNRLEIMAAGILPVGLKRAFIKEVASIHMMCYGRHLFYKLDKNHLSEILT